VNDERHRVIVIGPTPPPFNGMSVATELVLEGLGGAFDIYHLDTADRRGLSNIGKLDFRNVYLALLHGVEYLRALTDFRPDLVYVPISQSALPFLRDCLFLVPARLLRKRVVLHLHGSDFRNFYEAEPSWFRALMRFALGDARKAIVLGASLFTMFDGLLPVHSICAVSNGIPDLEVNVESRRGSAGPVTVLFLSTLMKEKGVLDLVAAIPAIIQRFPNCHFVFAGEWLRAAEQEDAERFIHQQGVLSFVTFAGPVGPVAKKALLQSAHVFVLPSYHEGQPFAILEALCAGLPIVTTDVGCIKDSVVDGKNGFIVERKSPESLAERLLLLLTNQDLRDRMGSASRDMYLSQHKAEVFVGRLSAVWSAALTADSL
jgi:glycosyltransferase involved in cell wall biosynthesis